MGCKLVGSDVFNNAVSVPTEWTSTRMMSVATSAAQLSNMVYQYDYHMHIVQSVRARKSCDGTGVESAQHE